MRSFFNILFSFSMFGMASTQVPSDFQLALQSIIEENLAAESFPGTSAGVYYPEFGYWQGSSGISHPEVDMDTSFLLGIASNTKLFTSVICLKMIEHGYFSLDDSLHMWLPDYQYVDPNITVRQLLRHESGLSDYINDQNLIPGEIMNNPLRIWEPEEIVAQIDEPWAAPGEIVAYSNINFILVAMVLEAATEMKYVDLVHDSIFSPLGLEDIYFEGFELIPDSMAHPFIFNQDYSYVNRTALGTLTWSAGSLVSRPRTVNKWYNAVFNSDFLSAEIKSELMDFIDWPDNMDGDRMGMGVYEIVHNGKKYYGHGGRTLGYSSFSLFDVECGYSVFVVNNEFLSGARDLAFAIAEKACELSSEGTNTEGLTELENIVNVFPNPADRSIQFTNSNFESLYDFSGKRMNITHDNNVLDVSTLDEGLYILNLLNGDRMLSKKVVIQH